MDQSGPLVAASRADPASAADIALLSGAARVLFAHGDTTRRMIVAVERLGQRLGLQVTVLPRWGELTLHVASGAGAHVESISVMPLGVDMSKVAAAHDLVDKISDKRLTVDAAAAGLAAVAHLPPVSLARFVLLTAAGAAALGVIFGGSHWLTLALIAVSAGIGACVRRWLAAIGGNPLVPPFAAALLAGAIGAAAVRLGLSSVLRLVAVCPCMVLVPGAHFLNGAIDLSRARIALGACRVGYAGLITLAISAGLLLGLWLGGANLPVSAPAAPVPFGYDVVAAGVAVAAYGTFFAMPWRMLPISIGIGMLAHAARWAMMTLLGAGAPAGALVACLLVGIIVTPVADRLRLPFAAFAFASVVSLIPGVYLFRMAAGLSGLLNADRVAATDLLLGTVADGTMALLIILAIAFGLILPKMCIEYFFPKLADAEPVQH